MIVKQARHIRDRLDRIEDGKEKPTKVGYTRQRKPKFNKRPRARNRPASYRGLTSKPKVGLQAAVGGAAYTKEAWARLKKQRKTAHRSRTRGRH